MTGGGTSVGAAPSGAGWSVNSGGIDLAAVQLRTLNRKTRIRVTFRLRSSAQPVSLEKPGGLTAEFVKNERTSRMVRVVTKDSVLRSEVCSYSSRDESCDYYNCSRLPVTQVDAKTYCVVVKRKQIVKGAKVLEWTATSMDLSSGSPVIDRLTARNGDTFRWRL